MGVPRYYFYRIHVLLFISILGLHSWPSGASARVSISPFKENSTVIVAHRGASGYAPENTLDSYRIGVRMQADYIEIDLRLTKDGELIAMHDETVDRTTNGTGLIKNMTLTEIKALDAGSWFNDKNQAYGSEEYVNEKVPTLKEIFETFGKDTRYLLETKAPEDYPGLEEKMLKLVEDFGLTRHIAVQSISKESLKKIRKRNKDVPLFQLFWYKNPASISSARLREISGYANGIGANFLRIDESYVRKVKNAGLLLYPYTVNYPLNMEMALRWGVDGVHTDYPDRLMKMIPEGIRHL
ncbi:glycerophosphodiester phosphodiesterase [Cohnella luojiensis]|nr:glycerophosphodiester phosphodiesterase [Cohnella luojiensis]